MGIIIGANNNHNAHKNPAWVKGSGTLGLLNLGPKRKYLEITLQAIGNKVGHSHNKYLLSALYGWELFYVFGYISKQNRIDFCPMPQENLYSNLERKTINYK